MEVTFSSVLDSRFRGDLERLLFFNPQQEKVETGIVNVVERYGMPRIQERDGRLRVDMERLGEVQALYALAADGARGRTLAGVVVYAREATESITVLHMAVHEDFSATGVHASELVVMRTMCSLREIASRIKGVAKIRLLYGGGVTKSLPVR